MTATCPPSQNALRTIVNPVIKDTVTFLETAAETGGKQTRVQVTLMPGGGTPPHYHKFLTETFEVISGNLGLEVDGKPVQLGEGKAVTVFPGMIHRFFNDGTEPVTFLTTITPGSRGFEQSLHILYGLAADGRTNKKAVPRSLTHLAIISDISDMHTTGFLALLNPLLRRLARKAKQSGAYTALVQRYCGFVGPTPTLPEREGENPSCSQRKTPLGENPSFGGVGEAGAR